MPDYGHDLLFGSFVPPVAGQADQVVQLAEVTDRIGLDLVSVHDHPYQPAFLDAWTLLSVIAAHTSRVRALPSVINLSLRPPCVPPERLAGMNRLIDDAARAAGRDPALVRRVYNVVGSFSGNGREFLQCPPPLWAEQLAELAVTEGEGVSAFIFPVEIGGESDLRRFADEVAPAVRELVAKERTGPTPANPAATAATGFARPGEPGGRLGVVPTPEPDQRHSEVRVWDEAARPTGPVPDPKTVYPDRGRATAQHLIDVHNHLRQELGQLRDLVRQVAAGDLDVGAVRSALNTMTMRQNRWTLDTFCESYCRVVTTHHTIEDIAMFPQLRRADSRLGPVIDRLVEEHEAIAGVLEQVDAALVAMVGSPDDGTAGVQAAVDLLTDTLQSHLSYEERELVEPIARLSLL